MEPALASLNEPPRRVPATLGFRLIFSGDASGVYLLMLWVLIPSLYFLGGGVKPMVLGWGPAGTTEVRIDLVQERTWKRSKTYTYHISYVVEGKTYQSSCRAPVPGPKERGRVKGYYSLSDPAVGWLPNTSPGAGLGALPLPLAFILLFVAVGHREGASTMRLLRDGKVAMAQRQSSEGDGSCWRFTPEESSDPVDVLVTVPLAHDYKEQEPLLYLPGDPYRNGFVRQLPRFVQPDSSGGWKSMPITSAVVGLLTGPGLFGLFLWLWWRFFA